jgi:hypothetical protein
MLTKLKRTVMQFMVSGYREPEHVKTIPRLRVFPSSRKQLGVPREVKERVLTLLENRQKRGWAVTSGLLGVSRKDATPAIVVTHPTARELCEEFFTSMGDDVDYLVEQGRVSRHKGLSSELQERQENPKNGSSIGSKDFPDLRGSLGGYIKPEGKNVLAMTCGHVLTGSTETSTSITCTQPSVHHTSGPTTTSSYQPNQELSRLGQKLSTCSRCRIPSQYVTDMCVCFGSTYVRDGKSSLRVVTKDATIRTVEPPIAVSIDWALLDNLSRVSVQNKVHEMVIKSHKQLKYDTDENGEILVGTEQEVFMQGARSGETGGTIQSSLVDCFFDDNTRPTKEVAIYGIDDKPFSDHGDSGSWVIERACEDTGCVIGVVLGGVTGRIACYSVMTAFEHILGDISDTLGMTVDESYFSWD